MTKYIEIEDRLYEISTLEQIEAAQAALREAGIEQAEVWVSPRPFAQIEEDGCPDACKNGQVLFGVG